MSIESMEYQLLIHMNEFIYHDPKTFEYHMDHVILASEYAQLINKKLGKPVDNRKLQFAALSHDLLKERGLKFDGKLIWHDHEIPSDLNRYVRTNLDVLAEFGLDDYFNTDVQYHALSAGIFIVKELNIHDPEIIYPIIFHSCPIIPVYETLDEKIQTMVDIMMLSDKLSSNWLRINKKGTQVRVDLDLLVFGDDGKEFNYTTGLAVARMIGQGASLERYSRESTAYYYQRAKRANPFLSKKLLKGENKIWPKRNSLLRKHN